MYSKNDYRNYLEHRLMESDDFLAHYGVKGMKWKKRKAAQDTINTDQERGKKLSERYAQFNDGSVAYRYSYKTTPGVQGRGIKLFGNDRTRRTKRVGTNTNSVKTRIKDKARRIREKHNARSSIFDRNNWKREKLSGTKLNNRTSVSYGEATIKPKSSNSSNTSTKKKKTSSKKKMKLNKRTTVTFNEATIK